MAFNLAFLCIYCSLYWYVETNHIDLPHHNITDNVQVYTQFIDSRLPFIHIVKNQIKV